MKTYFLFILIQEACQKCKIPLYTKIAFDEAMRWHSYTPSDQMILGSDVIALIHVLLDRVEKYHGTLLVEHALGYVTAAKAGIRYLQYSPNKLKQNLCQ